MVPVAAGANITLGYLGVRSGQCVPDRVVEGIHPLILAVRVGWEVPIS